MKDVTSEVVVEVQKTYIMGHEDVQIGFLGNHGDWTLCQPGYKFVIETGENGVQRMKIYRE